ncbi:MAG: membrane-bound O-acyltransferase family protein [Proteobacteria bacterium ST_bin11]|nr:MAG: membrane-bound O-acyltransferase family protein [Proteobacteria bacterium ST_bin11]
MLFNSYVFIFAFFPIVFFGFFRIGKYSHELASLWLAAASLFFYGWWDVRFVGLLLMSIAFNYCAGYLIGNGLQIVNRSKWLLIGAIVINLLLLGHFKYSNFLIENLNHLIGAEVPVREVFLPLGISFFTFTQIAFLVDTYQGKVKEYNFIHYLLFVTYFPHLIAGPVLHHKEMMPQFARRTTCQVNWENVSVGLAIFALGLFKKVAIADSMAEFSSPIFDAVQAGRQPMFVESWVGALSYTLQLYFDFSAYSDMAVGLSLMFNVRLPMNFNSPYKATSIIEFWRRWHMTLSRFLRDYLYIPLGGGRNTKVRRYFNLMITMVLGGLWHGAGWTFIVWGGMHGLYLMINHGWRNIAQVMGISFTGKFSNLISGILTFLAVVIGWVFFRAESLIAALDLLSGMAGLNGVSVHQVFAKYLPAISQLLHCDVSLGGFSPILGPVVHIAMLQILLGLCLVFLAPNTYQTMQRFRPTLEYVEDSAVVNNEFSGASRSRLFGFEWKPTKFQGALYGVLFYMALSYMASASKSEFLYFQF